MALGGARGADGQEAADRDYLVLTGILGLAFLVIKYFEYTSKFELHAAHHGASMIRLFPGAGIFEVTRRARADRVRRCASSWSSTSR